MLKSMANPKVNSIKSVILISAIALLVVSLAGCGKQEAAADKAGQQAAASIKLLNVSYDPTRELYKEFNEAFAAYWHNKTGQTVQIQQSHGGSGAQARTVREGIDADVVTLALAPDIDELQKTELLPADWQTRLAHNSTPYTSTIVFLVRKGNPQNIKDWDDLVRPGLAVITPNPKTSGGARWNHLAAWGYALIKNNNDENQAKEFISKLYQNVPVLDTGARGATTTFVERGIGDVLLAWENEALLAEKELGKDKFEIIAPSISILAEPPVAIIDRIVDKKGTRQIAQAYLEYLYTDQGQEIAAQNYYRPRAEAVAAKYAGQFPQLKLFTIADLGGWNEVHSKHFKDGGIFDQIYAPKAKQ